MDLCIDLCTEQIRLLSIEASKSIVSLLIFVRVLDHGAKLYRIRVVEKLLKAAPIVHRKARIHSHLQSP